MQWVGKQTHHCAFILALLVTIMAYKGASLVPLYQIAPLEHIETLKIALIGG
jgi:hypothetical protein